MGPRIVADDEELERWLHFTQLRRALQNIASIFDESGRHVTLYHMI